MVILAAVSINAAYNSGIINYAVNGTQQYVEGAHEEQSRIANAEGVMDSVMARLDALYTEKDEVDGDWIVAWVVLGADEESDGYWSNPYFKDDSLFADYFDVETFDPDYTISSINEVKSATVKALVFENEENEGEYTLVLCGTGAAPGYDSSSGVITPGSQTCKILEAYDYSDDFYTDFTSKISRLEVRNGISELRV